MIRVESTVGQLRVGDVIHGPFTDGPETVLRALVEREGCWTFETDVHNRENGCGAWFVVGPDTTVYVVFSSAREVGARIAAALEKFPLDIIAETLRFFCPTCGRRGCGQHR
jgi:hypothetical protein